MSKLLLEEETYAIRGCVYEVYREMGSGFLEAVYQECLEKEFALLGIPFEAQKKMTLRYKGKTLEQFYTADFVCHAQIIVELKAVKAITPEHRAQLLNYLKATDIRVGLLVNFGSHPKADIERLVL